MNYLFILINIKSNLLNILILNKFYVYFIINDIIKLH
jgi:hypothetical protein